MNITVGKKKIIMNISKNNVSFSIFYMILIREKINFLIFLNYQIMSTITLILTSCLAVHLLSVFTCKSWHFYFLKKYSLWKNDVPFLFVFLKLKLSSSRFCEMCMEFRGRKMIVMDWQLTSDWKFTLEFWSLNSIQIIC